jgi:hypothetical protein
MTGLYHGAGLTVCGHVAVFVRNGQAGIMVEFVAKNDMIASPWPTN